MESAIRTLLIGVAYPFVLIKLQELNEEKLQLRKFFSSVDSDASIGMAIFMALNAVWAILQLQWIGFRGRGRLALPNQVSLTLFALFSPLHIPTVVLRGHAANYISLNPPEVRKATHDELYLFCSSHFELHASKKIASRNGDELTCQMKWAHTCGPKTGGSSTGYPAGLVSLILRPQVCPNLTLREL